MSSRGNQDIFSAATNPTFHGGIFTAVNGEMHVHSPSPKRYGLELLLANITEGAFHNAKGQDDPPRCHPETRTAIRAAMMKWIKATDAQRKLIFWLYGPAGAGKTAIERSIAEQCEREGLLAASFFFSRGDPGRSDSSRFVATIAYQLSRSIPEIREPILAAVEHDPTIFSLSLSVQMRTLVIAPLKSVRLSSTPRAVVADGIDECGPDGDSQAELLSVLGAAAVELVDVPIIFVVASRPEFDIRFAFDQESLQSLTKRLFLDNDYQADADIRRYFISKFAEVRKRQLALGTDLRSWPAESDIDQLVEKSSGQFIFAATVMKFFDNPRRHPVDRLKIILGLSDAGKETPFEALDSLYRHILSAVDDLPKVLEVLTLLMLGNYGDSLTAALVAMLLGFDVHRALMDAHALLFIPHPEDHESTIRIHHASLFDFLMDQSRSRDYFIDAKQGHLVLCQRWFGMIAKYHLCHPRITHLRHCIECFVFHADFDKSSTSLEVANYLATLDLRAVLEKIDDIDDMYYTDWASFFDCAARYQQQDRANILHRFHNEYCSFVMDKIAQYPLFLQPYIPALFFHPNPGQRYKLSLILLRSAGESRPMLEELDRSLLMILFPCFDLRRRRPLHTSKYKDFLPEESYIQKSFKKRAALSYNYRIVIGESFAALAKNLIGLCPNDREPANGVPIRAKDLYDVDLVGLLRHCPIDLDLARMLQDHIHQNTDSPILRSISIWTNFPREVILDYVTAHYIKKCGIPTTTERLPLD